MKNKDVVRTLRNILPYAQTQSLDALVYAIKVLEKLEEDGIDDPLGENVQEENEK